MKKLLTLFFFFTNGEETTCEGREEDACPLSAECADCWTNTCVLDEKDAFREKITDKLDSNLQVRFVTDQENCFRYGQTRWIGRSSNDSL